MGVITISDWGADFVADGGSGEPRKGGKQASLARGDGGDEGEVVMNIR